MASVAWAETSYILNRGKNGGHADQAGSITMISCKLHGKFAMFAEIRILFYVFIISSHCYHPPILI